MRADPQTEAAIFDAVDAFLDHLANRRLDETLRAFASDADVALYGSEISEVMIGQAELRRFFERIYARARGPRFTLAERRASASGNVAWFTSAAQVQIGDLILSSYRLTGVLERRDGRWLWVLFNGSEPRSDRV